MRDLADIDALAAGPPYVVVVGAFDGLHRGHGRLLEALLTEARRLDAAASIVTFEPHPDRLFRGRAPLVLCDPDERSARFARAGVAQLVRQRFDAEFASQTAEAFVRRLGAHGRLRGLVLTPVSAFGRDRGGTAATLAPLATELGIAMRTVEPLARSGEAISSSRIRELVERGRLASARHLLGRRYAVVGEVVHGDARGRALGFPTANLAYAEPVALPPDGIYAVRAGWGGPDPMHPRQVVDGVASLGVRPTFDGGARVLEVNLFDVAPDLYGERLRVVFHRRQRGERRFPHVAALVAQMGRDATRARTILATAGPRPRPTTPDPGQGRSRPLLDAIERDW
jgi:riboflavin kinase/FMN adenylyltransferase